MKKIKIGIASFAHIHAYSYYDCIKKLPDVDVVAIAEENEYSKEQISNLSDLIYSDYEKLAVNSEIDVILVTTENKYHKKTAILAMENGKDVIVEKPIATSLEDADSMIKTAEKTGQKLIQCYPCRYHPTAISIKNEIDKGIFGELLSISATNHGQMPEHKGATKWFSQKELSGGGALMDHITHVADLNFWFSGQSIESVFALKFNLFHPTLDIDDAGMVYLNYDQGLHSTLDPSWSRPKNYETWGDLTMTIFGTERTLTFDMFAQSARVHSDKQSHPILINYGSNMDYIMLNDFIDCIRKDQMPMLSGKDGRKALEVALLAYKSAETGKLIKT
ncbi:MAG: hypothetical protein GF364_10335 [Candidatus Lokiarchaeota archaeon]|nr:hypothetical protein [Candidatus Lokiarchaeota archaeon]